MKSKGLLISLATCLLIGLVSCGNPSTSSSILSESSTSKEVTFQDMLDSLKGDSITYHGESMFYTYENKEPFTIEPMKNYHHEVFSKVSSDAYSVRAYVKETDIIASSINLTKSDKGKVVYNYLNINNEITLEPALDRFGNEISWDNSVYYNVFNSLSQSDFEKINEEEYRFIGDTNLILDLLHVSIPTSSFNLDYCSFFVKDNQISSILFQEKEDYEIWKEINQVYGRKVTVVPVDVNNTIPERVTPFESSEDNIPLGNALEELRNATSYEVVSTAKKEGSDNIINMQKTIVTENDIYQEVKAIEGGTIYQGIHTVDSKLYSYQSFDIYLLGELLDSNKLSDYLPKFNFSKDIFKFISEENNVRKYELRLGMESAINDIEFSSYHASDYYNGAGSVYFYVLNNSLVSVEFPMFLPEGDNAVIYTKTLNYLNVNSSTIPSSTWNKFVTEIPKNETPTSWDHESLKMNFYIDEETSKEMLPSEVFEKTLGSDYDIPFFLPEGVIFTSDGSYSSIDKCVYLSFHAVGVKRAQFNQMHMNLIDLGFEFIDFGGGILEYEKDDLVFGVVYIDGNLTIDLMLPVGNILS